MSIYDYLWVQPATLDFLSINVSHRLAFTVTNLDAQSFRNIGKGVEQVG